MTFHTSHHLCFSYLSILYILSESLQVVNGGGHPAYLFGVSSKPAFMVVVFLSFSCFGVGGVRHE